MNKAIITARRIAEIDPYVKVRVFEKGVNHDNIDQFIHDGGKLDLIIDECDSGDVKLLTRKVCRKLGIPLVMETSDRGLLDVERYDSEANLPLLHGMFDEADEPLNLSDEAKRNLLLKAVDFTKVSERGIQSMTEIGKSITSWPQLATDVVSGGATAAMAARLILLGHGLKSGRVYVDIQSRIFEELGASAFNTQGES
jgi:molybdopterin/thiamine biosynthesis adenylyltransferase